MSLPRDIEGVRLLAERLAREHAAAGGKVVGYVTPSVPAELIEAAGMWPIMLSAGAETSTTLGDRVMEDLFDTSVRGIFERLLKGEFGFLSAIVLPRARPAAAATIAAPSSASLRRSETPPSNFFANSCCQLRNLSVHAWTVYSWTASS